jgi:hypothetical protein
MDTTASRHELSDVLIQAGAGMPLHEPFHEREADAKPGAKR